MQPFIRTVSKTGPQAKRETDVYGLRLMDLEPLVDADGNVYASLRAYWNDENGQTIRTVVMSEAHVNRILELYPDLLPGEPE